MSSDLYIVRHAKAIERGSLEPDDNRWLTPEGRRAFYKAARRLSAKVERDAIAAVLTSPLPRAVMTAELLHRALRLRGPLEVYSELSPSGAAAQMQWLLSSQKRTVAVVGHEPMLSQLLTLLLGHGLEEHGLSKLRKGAIVALRLGARGAQLRYVIEPS